MTITNYKTVVDDFLDHDHFRVDTIEQFFSRWNLLYSARNDGKSVSIVVDILLRDFFTENKKFVYIRRRADEARPTKVTLYFRERTVAKVLQALCEISYGEGIYHIEAKRGQIWIYRDDELIVDIGAYCSLDRMSVNKSTGGADVYSNFLFEEFLNDKCTELEDEFELLKNTISTYARDNDFRFFGVGNAVRRRSEMFTAFDVNVDDIECGKIYTKSYTNNTLTIYHIPETKSRAETSKRFDFNDGKRSALIGNEWYIAEYPTISVEKDSEVPALSIRILVGQFELFFYILNSGKAICSKCKWFLNVNYITLCDVTNISRKWFKPESVPNLVSRMKHLFDIGYIEFENANCGDDLEYFLGLKK